MDTVEILALTLGAGWAAGLNLYAAVFMLGYMGATGNVDLPPGLEILSDPMVMTAAGIMYCVEFFADKTPGVDTGWDVIHTFIRIPAGAVLAAGAVSGLGVGEAAEFAAFLVGGTMAAGSHLTKTGSRILINTSPEPVTNWAASLAEDVAVIGGLWAALHYPVAFLILLGVFLLLVIWLLPKIWRALKRLFHRIRTFFSGRKNASPPAGGSRKDILKSLYHDAAGKPKE